MSDIGLDGMLAILIFIGLIAISLLGILAIIIITLVKNKRIQKPYSQYLLSSFIPLAIGVIGCLTIDNLNLNLQKTMDNWGAICIALLSIALSFGISLSIWKKIKAREELDY